MTIRDILRFRRGRFIALGVGIACIGCFAGTILWTWIIGPGDRSWQGTPDAVALLFLAGLLGGLWYLFTRVGWAILSWRRKRRP
jgi:hypothetical protein